MFENTDYLRHTNYTAGMLENRELLMPFAMTNELKIFNTMYKKTYR